MINQNLEFKPDILLSSDGGDRIYIEVAVSHKVDEVKASSGVKIIELFIDNEDQIKYLSSENALIRNENYQIKFHNFNVQRAYRFIEIHECKKEVFEFLVYKSGKTRSGILYIKDIYTNKDIIYRKNLNKDNIDIEKNPPTTLELSIRYIVEIEDAYKNGIALLSCHLCVNHEYSVKNDYLSHQIICKRYNNSIRKLNDVCEEFSADENSFYSAQLKEFLCNKQIAIEEMNHKATQREIEEQEKVEKIYQLFLA